MELKIHTEIYQQQQPGDIAFLELEGSLDQKSVPIFESTVQEKVYRQNICYVIIDLAKTRAINSTGYGLLINITHQIHLAGGRIALVNVSEKFQAILKALGLESRLMVYGSKEEALEALSQSEV